MESSNIVRCTVCGQSYDNRRNKSCPNCSQEVADSNIGNQYQSDADVTVMQRATFTSPIDATVSIQAVNHESPDDVTIGISLSESGNRRGEVTGWLVCVGGPDYGRDYQLRSNNNFVGRDMDMDVCIASDVDVHRQKHMTVVFEPNEKKFFCGPFGGAVCYLNGENITKMSELHDFDRIKLGSTELIFRSLCGEDFEW